MRQEADPTRVLDYASPRPRFHFRVHLPTAIVASVVLLALNVWPHFVTTVTPNMADVPEPELGWPWIFFFYGQMYSGYGPLLSWEALAYDVLTAGLVIVGAGHAACRITRRCSGSEPRV
ncbi:MAG TPA: hypothetical protein VH518_06385 [Tepidisphaeraceae bacterium]